MKKIVLHIFISMLGGVFIFASCKKENPGASIVTLPPPPPPPSQLVSIGTLSIPREYVCAATAGNKVLFAGGAIQAGPSYIPSSRVDIYDTSTHSWSTAELSMPRAGLVVASLGNKIYFTGGLDTGSSRIDIYDASTNTWSTAEFSTTRSGLVSGSAGNKVVFAGGYAPFDDKINILDASANTWSTAVLNEPRAGISATSLDNKIYFSGGLSSSGELSNKVDIYDAISNGWSTIAMTEPRWSHASIGADNKLFWAGGYSSFDSNGDVISNNSVEIYDVNNGGRTYHQLTRCPFTACTMNNKIIFFSAFYGTSFFADIYDITTQSWSVSNFLFPVSTTIIFQTIIGAGNKIFMTVSGPRTNSIKVWKLEF